MCRERESLLEKRSIYISGVRRETAHTPLLQLRGINSGILISSNATLALASRNFGLGVAVGCRLGRIFGYLVVNSNLGHARHVLQCRERLGARVGRRAVTRPRRRSYILWERGIHGRNVIQGSRHGRAMTG